MGFMPRYTRSATLVVAASDSRDTANADYICDGTDDQVEINNAITALGTGAVILLEGTFNITASVNLTSNVALVGQGAGTVLRIPDGHNANLNVIYASSEDHLLITNLRIDGNRANQTAGTMHGIYFDTVTYSKVESCWVENFRNNGIYLDNSSSLNALTNNTCRNNEHGISLSTSSEYNTVTGNTCNGNSGDGIVLFTASNHNTVSGNTCQGDYRGIDLQPSSDYNTVTGNTVTGNTQHGIYVDTSCHNTITGNTCQGSGQNGIYVDVESEYNTVTGNTCQGNGRRGIQVQWGHNSFIGNTCDGNTRDGIYMTSASDCTITGNTCQGNDLAGIHCRSSGNNTITGNTCNGNGRHGIYVDVAGNNTIAGNTMVGNSQEADNTYDGIFVDADSDYNNIQGNTVRHAGGASQHRYGIRINNINCDGSFVHGNDLYNAGRTLDYSDAGAGTIYHNTRTTLGWVP